MKSNSKKSTLLYMGTPKMTWGIDKLRGYLLERLPGNEDDTSEDRLRDLLAEVEPEWSTNRLSNCCGAVEVGLFRTYTADLFDNLLEPCERRVTRAMVVAAVALNLLEADDNGSCYIATTIPTQRQGINALRELGFKVVDSFVNASTKNTVTLWKIVIAR